MSEITPETLERLKLQLQYAHTIQMKALRPFRQGLNDALQQFSDKREEFAFKEVVDLLNKALEPEPFFASFIINLAFGPLAGALVQGFTSRALRPILGQRKVFTIKTKVKIEGQKVPKGSTGKKYKYEFPDKETLNSLGIKIKKQGKKKASAVLDEGLEIYNNQEIFDLLNNGAQAILETVIETSGERLSTTQVEQKSSHSKPPSTQTAATSISSNFNQFINQQEDAIDDLYFLLVGTGLGEGQINKLSEDTATTLLELLALMFPVGQYRIPNEAYLKDAFAVFVEACIWVRQFGSVDNIFARKRKSEPVEEGQQKSTKSSYGTGDPRLGNFEAKQLPKFKTVETEEIIWKVKGYYLDYWFSRFPRPPDAEQKNKDKDKDKGGLTTEQQSFQAYWESLSANNRFFRNTDTNKKVRNQKLGKELIAYFKNIERALKDMGPSSPDELFANETTS